MLALAVIAAASVESSGEAAREFARKISASLAPRESVALTVRNVSALSAAEVSAVEQAVEGELRAHGFALGDAPEFTPVKITLSANGGSWLWIAEIQRADKRDVVMLAVPRGNDASESSAEPALAIEKKPLWEQDEPILDIAAVGGESIVLDLSGVSIYGRENERWVRHKAFRIAVPKPWPKDARGRLQLGTDSIRAWLPGVSCTGKLNPELTLDCSEAVSGWPLAIPNALLAPGRNWFSVPGIPPFFSAADAGEGWVATGIDGRAQLYDQALKPMKSIEGWGSDVAALDTACGRYVLAVRPGDWDEPDAVEPYAIRDGRAVVSGAAVEFPGPVTAFWPSADGHAVVAVAHNVKTGRYAAFSLSIGCNR
ncbi:MAG: hypothetical protein ABSG25_07545 [Bryobacteraceae bacterium]